MNKMYEFVATQLIDCERKAIIADYDELLETGVVGNSVLNYQAKCLIEYLFGEGIKSRTTIKLYRTALYREVCRYYADKYLNENQK